ncbi:MAG: hypothetical protein H3C62_11030, partial [Gemmatimonadaceae bacterium]|nr:hypothetical protein [Gemmatimonadaceae bacterium]
LYLILATEASFGRIRRLSSTAGPQPLTNNAVAWHQRLFGYDIPKNANRFYANVELALDELATYGIVGPQSGITRASGNRAPLRTEIRVQAGPALDVIPLLRSATLADSPRDRHLLVHLTRMGVNAPTARELLHAGPDVVTRVLLQAYWRRDAQKRNPTRSWAAFLVEAIRADRSWVTDAKAVAWANEMLLEAARPRGAPRLEPPPQEPGKELVAYADILRARNAVSTERTKLVGYSLAHANPDGNVLTLEHQEFAAAAMRALAALPEEQVRLWKIIDETFPDEIHTCVITAARRELSRFSRTAGVAAD